MTLGKQWFGILFTGVGLMLFGSSSQQWQVWFASGVIAAGIVFALPDRFTKAHVSKKPVDDDRE